ncbi:MAG: putative PEP-binding protein, partial [Planctomycetota bacterium]
GEDCGIEVSMCGEMCGEVKYAILLLGMGLKEFSVSPGSIPDIKKAIRSLTMQRAREVASEAFTFADADETEAYLQDVIHRLLPQDVR